MIARLSGECGREEIGLERKKSRAWEASEGWMIMFQWPGMGY